MNLQDIRDEDMLRKWLAARVSDWNNDNVDKVRLDWIEPNFGSSMGVPDCAISFRAMTFAIELKHWYELRGGVNYKIRPVQRRYHVMNYRAGKKLLIMATVAKDSWNDLVLIRGDKVPLRDYCSILGSGCTKGIIQTIVPQFCPREDGNPRRPPSFRWTLNGGPFESILVTLADPAWWQ